MSELVTSFVGPPTRIQGRVNAGPDEILVILRNGRPDRVVEPGRRVGRAWGAPMLGVLDVLQVNVTSMTMRLTLKDVTTSEVEGYAAPSVTVEFTVRLGDSTRGRSTDGRPDYSGFATLVRAEGTRFADVLLLKMRAGVERMVRAAFRATTHDSLYQKRDRAFDGALPLVIDGLMTVNSAMLAEVTWSADYLEARRHEALLTASGQRASLEAAGHLDRIAALAPVAERTGVPILELLFPEREREAADRRHELVRTVLANPALLSRVSREPLLQQALGFTASASSGTHPGNQLRLENGRSGPLAGVALPVGSEPGMRADGLDDTLVLRATSAADFTIDARHRRAWESGQGSTTGIVGLAGAASGGRAVVVAVGSDSRPRVGEQVVARLAALYQAAPVTVLSLIASSAEELALDWFMQMRAGLPDAVELRARIEVDAADRLWINVSGPLLSARAAVKTLTAPNEPALAALAAVMPYADVCLQLDSRP